MKHFPSKVFCINYIAFIQVYLSSCKWTAVWEMAYFYGRRVPLTLLFSSHTYTSLTATPPGMHTLFATLMAYNMLLQFNYLPVLVISSSLLLLLLLLLLLCTHRTYCIPTLFWIPFAVNIIRTRKL